ncbi:MAG: PhnD/SsuA/transferrin family substrate-binding protein [Melioribacteraceae bacterium]
MAGFLKSIKPFLSFFKPLFMVLFINQYCFAQGVSSNESNIGITKEMFSDVNIRDAKASIELWIKMIQESFTTIKKSNAFVYEDINDLTTDLNNAKIDYVFINTPQYLNFKSVLNLKPYYGTLPNKEKFFDLFLLIKNDKNIKSFSELKNTKITIHGGRYKMLIDLWLDYLCLQNGAGAKEKFFKKIEYVDNASKTILSTFFDKSDLCIVTSSTFDVMSEMNPQVKKGLSVLYKREKLINDLFCFRNNIPDWLKKSAFGFGKEIDSKAKTSHIYKILKIDGSYLLQDEDLAATINLWESYKKLKTIRKK